MFDDLDRAVSDGKIPDSLKLATKIVLKGISWFPWVFFFVGTILKAEFFVYWLAFFLFVEGALVVVLLQLVVLLAKLGAQDPRVGSMPENPETNSAGTTPRSVKEAIHGGIVGNVAFYLFLIVIFIVVKLTGLLDGAVQWAFGK